MPWSILTPILIWAALFVLLTLLVYTQPIRNKLTTILIFLAYTAFNLYFVLVLNWSLVNYWLRAVPVIACLVFLLRSVLRWKHKPFLPEHGIGGWWQAAAAVVLLALAGTADAFALRSFTFQINASEPAPLLMMYPAQKGIYVIANGGNGLDGVGMNNHIRDWLGRRTSESNAQAYAVDIVEIRTNGMMADSYLDRDFNHYESHLDPVYAPCPGTVVFVENSIPDARPFSETPSDPLGNRVVIQCFDVFVTLANLQRGTDLVQVGEELSMRRIIGYVGVSGSPAVPHLHVHVTGGSWDENGIPVPILFEYSFDERNRLYLR